MQGAYRRLHREHAREENSEADQHLTELPLFDALGRHIQNDADHRRQRREGRRLEELQKKAVALNIRKADQLGGYGGADICAHNDPYSLPKRHDARIDQADNNDGGGG